MATKVTCGHSKNGVTYFPRNFAEDLSSVMGYGDSNRSSGGPFGREGSGGSSYDDRSLGSGLKNIDWSSQSLSHFEKNFYHEDPRVTARSDSEVEEYRRIKDMKVGLQGVCRSMKIV
jgi:ATP-dependent RNA helicase DDX5/DBP2